MDGSFSATRHRVSGGIGSLLLFGVIAVAISCIWRLLQFYDVPETPASAKRTAISGTGRPADSSAATHSQIVVVSFPTTTAWVHPTSPSRSVNENVDVNPTSWQEPFRSELWLSRGWTFDGESMQSTEKELAEATFRRPYRKLMLDMQIEPLQRSGAFDVRFVSPERHFVSCVELDNDGRAQAQHAERKTIQKRSMNLDWRPGQSARFIVAATGNRIVISWNGQRVLNCAQPAEQSGHLFFCSFVSHGAAFRITNLRIEGE